MIRLIPKIFVILLLSALSVHSRTDKYGWIENRHYPAESSGSIGLALSGGGARGLSQIGILKAFEESGIKISAISGTSIGGIVGGLYASGYSAGQLDTAIGEINFDELFSNRPERQSMFLTQRPEKERYIFSIGFEGITPTIPQALTAGQKLSDLLLRLTIKPNYLSGGKFLNLPTPFSPVTTDIVSGRQIVLTEGNLADAMRATMAFPLAFTGVEYNDMLLMDGGMLNPVPVDVLTGMNSNPDAIVAVNTTSELLPKDDINNPIDVANQVTSIMTMDKVEAALDKADIVITPDIEQYQSMDFDKSQALIDSGYQAGLAAAREILNLIDQKASLDSLCIVEISYRDMGGFEFAELNILEGDILPQEKLRQTLRMIYRDYNLFSLKVEYSDHDINGERIRNSLLRISAVECPELTDIDIKITGNTIIDDSTIINLIKGSGKYLTAPIVSMIKDSIIERYNFIGYDMIRPKNIEYDHGQKLLNIEIDEGVVEEIIVKGNDKTKQWLILSNFPIDVGQVLNFNDAQRGIGNLYGTDLFDRVTMNIIPGQNGAIIQITVEEKSYTQMRFGWRWDDEYESEEFGEILKDNLFGAGQEFLLHAQYSPRRQIFSTHLKADRFLSTYLTYKAEVYYKYLERQIYDIEGNKIHRDEEDRFGFQFIVGQQISRFGTVTGEIKWEEIDNKNSFTGINEDTRLRTVTLRSLVETINKYPFPTAGKKHLFYVEFAADILGGDDNYTKFFSSIESYFPLTESINFHPRLSIGWTAKETVIPVPEKFHIGGQYSFAGYRTDELVGDNMFLGNSELRCKMPYGFYITGRYDLGQMFNNRKDIKLNNLKSGFGVSLSYDSPIGPIDLGYGKAEHTDDLIYFSAGLKF